MELDLDAFEGLYGEALQLLKDGMKDMDPKDLLGLLKHLKEQGVQPRASAKTSHRKLPLPSPEQTDSALRLVK